MKVQQIVDFITELDKLKSVTRKVRPRGLHRYENTAEHSWQITLLALSLADSASEPVNIDRVIRMLLVHDIGEIDAGDTIVFAEHGWKEQKAAERRPGAWDWPRGLITRAGNAPLRVEELPQPRRSHPTFLEWHDN
jgi:5'-deoxynucleotidase YfbR-like HD superfamily hydrolase